MKNLKQFIKTTIRKFLNENKISINYISGVEFKQQYCDRYNKFLWKGYFDYENKEDEEKYGVSDINQYGYGSYFCTTFNCESHYSDNIGYIGYDEFLLSPNSKICVGDYKYFLDNEEKIRKTCDGFYDPEYDTFGLIVWNRNAIIIK